MKVDTDDPLYFAEGTNGPTAADLPSFVAQRVIGSLGESLDPEHHDGLGDDTRDCGEHVETIIGDVEHGPEIDIDRPCTCPTSPEGASTEAR